MLGGVLRLRGSGGRGLQAGAMKERYLEWLDHEGANADAIGGPKQLATAVTTSSLK